MKTVHLMAAAAAALLLAGACTHEMTTALTEDEGAAELFEGQEESPCITYSYSFEYVTGGIPEALKDKINGYIVRYYIAYDEASTSTDVPEACKAWAERTAENYISNNEEYLEDEDYDPENAWMFNWESHISGRFGTRCDARNWQTYNGGGSDYMGGVHPFSYSSNTVFDMKTGETVEEKDFLDIENEDLYDLFFAKVMETMGDEDNLLDVPTFNGNFSVSNEGVTWLFNQYEIAPYAWGPIEATLTWDELEPYLLKK